MQNLNVQIYISTAVIEFKSGAKLIINSEYLQEMVSFNSHEYAS